MNVLMVGVDESTKGGMWTVVENYLKDSDFVRKNNITYVPTSITGSVVSRILFTFKAYINIFNILRKRKTDITHVHMSEKGSVYRKAIVLKMAKHFGSKTIIHMHGAEFEDWYKTLDDKKQSGVRKIINDADKIIILGNYWCEFISSLIDNKEKIKVVYNAVNMPNENPYSEKSNKILFLGAVSQRKGIYDLLDSLKSISDEIKEEYEVCIYGPNVIGNVEEEISKRNLNDLVKYCGWLDNNNKNDFLKQTCINILPSYNEGLPMTILETMAHGVPSITTNVAAIPEAVNDDNGVLIAPGDINALSNAIVELCTNDDLRMKKSDSAYNTIKNKFSLSKHLDEINNIYEEL